MVDYDISSCHMGRGGWRDDMKVGLILYCKYGVICTRRNKDSEKTRAE